MRYLPTKVNSGVKMLKKFKCVVLLTCFCMPTFAASYNTVDCIPE
jgi:hypothetical protein